MPSRKGMRRTSTVPPFVLTPPVRKPDVLWVHVPDPHRGVSVGTAGVSGAGPGCHPLLPLLPCLLPSLLHTRRATRLFCDVYNPQSKTYCKRLQVLCPEHSRDPKVSFPLSFPHSVPLPSPRATLPSSLSRFPSSCRPTSTAPTCPASSPSVPLLSLLHPLLLPPPRLSFPPPGPHSCPPPGLAAPHSRPPRSPRRCQLTRYAGAPLYVTSLSSRVSSAACPSASVTATTAGRSCGVPRWTWSACAW